MPENAVQALMGEMEIGYWGLRFGLYGPQKVVGGEARAIEAAFSKSKART